MVAVIALAVALSGVAVLAPPAPTAQAVGGFGTLRPYPEELVAVAEGNRLRRVDPDTVVLGADGTTDPTRLRSDIFLDRAASGGRDVNGMRCAFPDGSGRFIMGEDSGQPHPPPGWGIFDAAGTQIGKLATTANVTQAEPFGCAFLPDGRLVTTEVGSQGFGPANGQLIIWFPPFDRFPGAPGAYPGTDALSTNSCKLAVNIGTAGAVAVDDAGRIYVAESSSLRVERFTGPFPTGNDAARGCGSTDATGAPLATAVTRANFIEASQGMLTFSGLAWAPNGNLYASSVFTGRIAEYNRYGTLVRKLLEPPETFAPHATGSPQGLAVTGDGTVYYADLDLVGTLPNVGPGPNGKLRRIRFDADGNPLQPETVLAGLAFPDGATVIEGDLEVQESRGFAGGHSRRFSSRTERYLTPETAPALIEKWRYRTGAIVTGSPAVANVALPEGHTRVVYITSWDHHVYALRFDDGSLVWKMPVEEQPGATFPAAASVQVSTIGGVDTVIVGVGEILYALDAVTGAQRWRFTAGTGCRDEFGNPPGNCRPGGERNEIESSVSVAGNLVVFGYDVNDLERGKGGIFGLDATTGRMRWFLDLQTGGVCRPRASDTITRFDSYHTEAELALPAGFFASRTGCGFPRDRNGCGNVWSSAAYDAARRWFFIATSNCDTDTDPATSRPSPPMPIGDEALLAFDRDGVLQWRWRPREVDNADLAFGGAPNLFTIRRGGRSFDAVGIGNKDGTYTVLDRNGVNQETGRRWDEPGAATELPYWSTKVIDGGPIGGIPQTASVDTRVRRVYASTAPGFNPIAPQHPTVHALDLDSGAIIWQNTATQFPEGDASFGPTSSVPGVVLVGSVVSAGLRLYRGSDGELLRRYDIGDQALSAVASGATVIDGTVLVGTGIGARSGNPADIADVTSRIPSSIVALCVSGAPDCPDHEVAVEYTAAEAAILDTVARRLGTDRAGAQTAGSQLLRWFAGLMRAQPAAPPAPLGPTEGSGPISVTSRSVDQEWASIASASDWWGTDAPRLHHDGVLLLGWMFALGA